MVDNTTAVDREEDSESLWITCSHAGRKQEKVRES